MLLKLAKFMETLCQNNCCLEIDAEPTIMEMVVKVSDLMINKHHADKINTVLTKYRLENIQMHVVSNLIARDFVTNDGPGGFLQAQAFNTQLLLPEVKSMVALVQ